MEGVNPEQEDDNDGLLGVELVHNDKTGLLEMRQDELINRVIEDLGLDNGTTKVKWTPDKAKPYIKDEDGVIMSEQLFHISIVGVMLYLAGYTCLEIDYAVNCYERYMLGRRNSHESSP